LYLVKGNLYKNKKVSNSKKEVQESKYCSSDPLSKFNLPGETIPSTRRSEMIFGSQEQLKTHNQNQEIPSKNNASFESNNVEEFIAYIGSGEINNELPVNSIQNSGSRSSQYLSRENLLSRINSPLSYQKSYKFFKKT